MSGIPRPDPAFLHNVPTSISSSVTSVIPSTALSLTSLSLAPSSTTSALASATSSSGPGNPSEPSSIYFYNPSTPLAIVFSVLYALLVPYHFYFSIYKPFIAKSVAQKHKYTIPLFVAAVLSTAGFSLRIASVSSESGRSSVGLYASSQTWVIIAPIFVCATLYLLVTHLIQLCLPPGRERIFLGISPRWLGRIFITSDVLSFLAQGAGSGVAASGNWEGSEKDAGTAILIAGLACQLATFTIYMAVLTLFCLRVKSGHEGKSEDQEMSGNGVAGGSRRDYGFNPLVKQVVRGMWIASVLVEVRSIYRTIEFGTGIDGYLFHHEWALWVFEAVPMWVALLVLGFWHPVKWLQQKRRSQFTDKHNRAGEQSGRLPK